MRFPVYYPGEKIKDLSLKGEFYAAVRSFFQPLVLIGKTVRGAFRTKKTTEEQHVEQHHVDGVAPGPR